MTPDSEEHRTSACEAHHMTLLLSATHTHTHPLPMLPPPHVVSISASLLSRDRVSPRGHFRIYHPTRYIRCSTREGGGCNTQAAAAAAAHIERCRTIASTSTWHGTNLEVAGLLVLELDSETQTHRQTCRGRDDVEV